MIYVDGNLSRDVIPKIGIGCTSKDLVFVFEGPCAHTVWKRVRQQYDSTHSSVYVPGTPCAIHFEKHLTDIFPGCVILSSRENGTVWEKICCHVDNIGNADSILTIYSDDVLGAMSFLLNNRSFKTLLLVKSTDTISIGQSEIDRKCLISTIGKMILMGNSPAIPALQTNCELHDDMYDSDNACINKHLFANCLISESFSDDGDDPYLETRKAVAYFQTLESMMRYHINSFSRHGDTCIPYSYNNAPNVNHLRITVLKMIMNSCDNGIHDYSASQINFVTHNWNIVAHALSIATPSVLKQLYPSHKEFFDSDSCFPDQCTEYVPHRVHSVINALFQKENNM